MTKLTSFFKLVPLLALVIVASSTENLLAVKVAGTHKKPPSGLSKVYHTANVKHHQTRVATKQQTAAEIQAHIDTVNKELASTTLTTQDRTKLNRQLTGLSKELSTANKGVTAAQTQLDSAKAAATAS